MMTWPPFSTPRELQSVRESAILSMQRTVREDAFAAVVAESDECRMVAQFRTGVPVERVDRDVRLPAYEPVVMNAIPFENLAPRL